MLGVLTRSLLPPTRARTQHLGTRLSIDMHLDQPLLNLTITIIHRLLVETLTKRLGLTKDHFRMALHRSPVVVVHHVFRDGR